MRVRLIAAGSRLPAWINAGYAGYAGRFGPGLRLELVEIAMPRRGGKPDLARALVTEGRRMLAAIGPRDFVVALDVSGSVMTTAELSHWLAARLAGGRDLSLVIGGPEGIAPEVLARADFRWSLSPLTWPHGLVRVLVAEQLFRAWSLLQGHPYHRD